MKSFSNFNEVYVENAGLRNLGDFSAYNIPQIDESTDSLDNISDFVDKRLRMSERYIPDGPQTHFELSKYPTQAPESISTPLSELSDYYQIDDQTDALYPPLAAPIPDSFTPSSRQLGARGVLPRLTAKSTAPYLTTDAPDGWYESELDRQRGLEPVLSHPDLGTEAHTKFMQDVISTGDPQATEYIKQIDDYWYRQIIPKANSIMVKRLAEASDSSVDDVLRRLTAPDQISRHPNVPWQEANFFKSAANTFVSSEQELEQSYIQPEQEMAKMIEDAMADVNRQFLADAQVRGTYDTQAQLAKLADSTAKQKFLKSAKDLNLMATQGQLGEQETMDTMAQQDLLKQQAAMTDFLNKDPNILDPDQMPTGNWTLDQLTKYMGWKPNDVAQFVNDFQHGVKENYNALKNTILVDLPTQVKNWFVQHIPSLSDHMNDSYAYDVRDGVPFSEDLATSYNSVIRPVLDVMKTAGNTTQEAYENAKDFLGNIDWSRAVPNTGLISKAALLGIPFLTQWVAGAVDNPKGFKDALRHPRETAQRGTLVLLDKLPSKYKKNMTSEQRKANRNRIMDQRDYYTGSQWRALQWGTARGLNTAAYDNMLLDTNQMREVRAAVKAGVDPALINDAVLSSEEMYEIRLAAEDGIDLMKAFPKNQRPTASQLKAKRNDIMNDISLQLKYSL